MYIYNCKSENITVVLLFKVIGIINKGITAVCKCMLGLGKVVSWVFLSSAS